MRADNYQYSRRKGGMMRNDSARDLGQNLMTGEEHKITEAESARILFEVLGQLFGNSEELPALTFEFEDNAEPSEKRLIDVVNWLFKGRQQDEAA